jgi:hypothetical protein
MNFTTKETQKLDSIEDDFLQTWIRHKDARVELLNRVAGKVNCLQILAVLKGNARNVENVVETRVQVAQLSTLSDGRVGDHAK